MIKTKLGDAVLAMRELEWIGDTFHDYLLAADSYAIAKTVQKIRPEYEIYERRRLQLVEKYGEKDEEGKIKVKNGEYVFADRDGFEKEFNELYNVVVEIDTKPLSIESFAEIKGIKQSSFQILDKFIID